MSDTTTVAVEAYVPPPGRNSEMPTSEVAGPVPPDSITAGQSGSPVLEPVQISELEPVQKRSLRERAARAWAASRAYWTPPDVFTQRPPSLQGLAAYARRAPWTHQQTGPIRAAGVGYYRFVGYPYTVVSRYREFIVQRPLRLVYALGTVKILSLTGPGDWAVHHLVYPVVETAGRILL